MDLFSIYSQRMSMHFAQHLSSCTAMIDMMSTHYSHCTFNLQKKTQKSYGVILRLPSNVQKKWPAQMLMFIGMNYTCIQYSYLLKNCYCCWFTGAGIGKFLSYHSTFPQATIPKMHFLEDHTVFWIKKWRTGFGFLGEEGEESIHKQFNSLERSYNGIPNKVEWLHHIVEAHTQVCPELEERPQGSPRKKKRLWKVVLYWTSEFHETCWFPSFEWKFDSWLL